MKEAETAVKDIKVSVGEVEKLYQQCSELSEVIRPIKEVNKRHQQVCTLRLSSVDVHVRVHVDPSHTISSLSLSYFSPMHNYIRITSLEQQACIFKISSMFVKLLKRPRTSSRKKNFWRLIESLSLNFCVSRAIKFCQLTMVAPQIYLYDTIPPIF